VYGCAIIKTIEIRKNIGHKIESSNNNKYLNY